MVVDKPGVSGSSSSNDGRSPGVFILVWRGAGFDFAIGSPGVNPIDTLPPVGAAPVGAAPTSSPSPVSYVCDKKGLLSSKPPSAMAIILTDLFSIEKKKEPEYTEWRRQEALNGRTYSPDVPRKNVKRCEGG